MYARRLEAVGVDIPKEKLAGMAHQAFNNLQKEMESIAARLAKERGWQSASYRDVIRQLKADQIVGDAILPHYQERIRQIEEIVRREDLVTLPDRPARMRIAKCRRKRCSARAEHATAASCRQHRRVRRLRASSEHTRQKRPDGNL
jgi:hypothetical protein